MDISEKRAPQDGQFTVTFRGHRIDLRVSTLPTVRGEKVVMRILDSRSVLVGLDNTGIGPEELRVWRELIRLPGGILLVTGPTGSGKSTTLYGSLNEINSPELNIVTVEDPVEYKLPSIGQIQVNPAGRGDLRHRPALHPPSGPRRDHGRRNPRPGDRGHRHPGRADRSPGLLHAAHHGSGGDADAAPRHGPGALPRGQQRARGARAAARARPVPSLPARDAPRQGSAGPGAGAGRRRRSVLHRPGMSGGA